MKKLSFLFIGITLLLFFAYPDHPVLPNQNSTSQEQKQKKASQPSKQQKHTGTQLKQAFEQQNNGIMLEGTGVITALLRDDKEGSRHQRFIVTLASGQSLLVAHNIDLAPRINHLKKGEYISFYGQYEWNKKGGTIHWTHKDPKGRHTDGWLEYQGEIYQ